ncbi:OLC1v1008322C1 [Oldenlandia corymbosa var. corymbosa]|uniref:OLC1v1008322C1 n=1 Tax=Oldenlandia corymbosa var. corymbosa TaxID=529605 RepID=A0AAV1DNT0_OLDCO|nr:OLC1v1008322C1 [Oldenlandia corymbosa var. corymbosa]
MEAQPVENTSWAATTPPQSPGVGPVHLKDCIEELLKFTLTSSINGELDLGLSKDYCSQLLRDDDDNNHPLPPSSEVDLAKGVPMYPLYKHLAASLHQSISSGAFLPMSNQLNSTQEDSSMKLKEDEWIKLITEKGSLLLNMLAIVDFEFHVQEPFFTQLKDGCKIVEGRCAVGKYNRMLPGALILFNKSLLLQVQQCNQYASFHDMLEAEGLQRVLPGVKTVQEGVQVYRNFYSEEKERSNGVLAICVTKPTSQLCDCIAGILLGLSYGGVRRMLNMVHTEGTFQEGLPPPASTLVSSFSTRHNPCVL